MMKTVDTKQNKINYYENGPCGLIRNNLFFHQSLYDKMFICKEANKDCSICDFNPSNNRARFHLVIVNDKINKRRCF